jgi:nickel-dependent lactate racemase
MKVKLTKNIFGDLEIPDSNILGIYSPRQIEGNGLTDFQIRQALAEPIGTEPLHRLVKGCENVLVVTDDNTRETPLDRILPHILSELHDAGVPDSEVTILIGLGTHRPMTSAEIQVKFGSAIAKKYRIINHAWDDPASLVSIGNCEFGFEIIINKLVQETDLLISVGSIVPHATAGFSGGGKTIMPGICGEKTIEETHWTALNYSMNEILGRIDNPIREAINIICRQVNLSMIVNAVLFKGNKIYSLVAGDLETAFRQGVDLSRQVFGVPVKGRADIVIAEAYPTDIDLRQAIKAICSSDLVCRDGGVVILPAECPEGISPQFPDFEKHGFSDPERLFQLVEEGLFKQKLMTYTIVAVGRIISKRVRAILVSPGIDEITANKLGFLWSSDLQSAVDRAFGLVGDKGKIAVLNQASQVLPLIKDEA